MLAEKLGQRVALSAAWARHGFIPAYDRGQLAVDLALTLLLGGEAISDFQGLRHLAPVTGPVASTPTVWPFLDEAGEETLTGLNHAVAGFHYRWWELLAARPQGFPSLAVAGKELTGITVAELTGLLGLSAWTKKIPGLRILVRDEPLHPKYLARATEQEKQKGQRYQLIAINARVGQLAWLDARHRSHVHVENDVKQGKRHGTSQDLLIARH